MATRERWLGAVADFSIARAKLVLAAAAALLALGSLLAYDVPINTSRYDLLSPDHPQQARLLRFFERFGYPSALVFVVRGGDETARRRAVDQLSVRLEQQPELAGRVLGRTGVEQIAELLLLMAPAGLERLRAELGPDPQLADLVEGGLPAWVGAVTRQLRSGLEGAPGGPSDTAEATQGMTAMADMLQGLGAALAPNGDGAAPALPSPGAEQARRAGIDEQGYLVGAEGQLHLVAMFPELPEPEGAAVRPFVERLRGIRDELSLGPVQADLTGLPALAADEHELIQRGVFTTSLAAAAGIALVLLLAFRSLRAVALALVPLTFGAIATLAVARLAFGGLNLVTSSFMSVLLGLGIGFGVFILQRYGELIRSGRRPADSIRGAVARAGPGILIAALTTALAFLTLTTVEFTAYAELGQLAASGIALMLVATFLLLPALLWVVPRGRPLRIPALPGAAALPGVIRRASGPIAISAIALVGIAALGWPALRFNLRYFDFLPQQTESMHGLEQIEDDPNLSVVQASVPAESIVEARRIAEHLRELPVVGAVQSATDVVPEIDADDIAALRSGLRGLDRPPDFDALRERPRDRRQSFLAVRKLCDGLDEIAYALRRADRPTEAVGAAQRACASLLEQLRAMPADATPLVRFERRVATLLERAWRTAERVAKRGEIAPQDLPLVLRARYASKDGQALAVYVTPAGDVWTEPFAGEFTAAVREHFPEAVGLALELHEQRTMIQGGFARAAGLCAAMVFVVLLVGFRRASHAALAGLPVLIGLSWLLGVMGAFGLHFNVANVVMLPLLLGIGVDAGAHMMHRWRSTRGEVPTRERLAGLVQGTGAAVLLAALSAAVGFAALLLGDYGGMRSLGLVMTLGIIGCLLASIIALPALLLLLDRHRRRRHHG